MKRWIARALVAALAGTCFTLTSVAADQDSKTPRKPLKRATLTLPSKESATAGRSAPAPSPAPIATVPAPQPTPLHREDVTLEEMHRYHQ